MSSFIARVGTETTLIGIDENTALIHDGKWRVAGAGKVHLLRGDLEIA